MNKILVINGPNLNLLGTRESGLYGSLTLDEIIEDLREEGLAWGITVDAYQSNHEGEIVEAIQGAPGAGYSVVLINPAAFTHTSVAVRDALLAAGLPFIEVHISNIHAREPFRRKSLVSDIASGIVMGFGPAGYRLALMGARNILEEDKRSGKEVVS